MNYFSPLKVWGGVLLLLFVVGVAVGSSWWQDDRYDAVDCTPSAYGDNGDHTQLARLETVVVRDGDDRQTITQKIFLGDCQRISEDSLTAVLDALVKAPTAFADATPTPAPTDPDASDATPAADADPAAAETPTPDS